MNRGRAVAWSLAQTLTGDQSASQRVCCSASWQLWQGTVIPESSVHFWGLWQKGSSVQLSLLSWSVTTYRQTLVSDGFCSCTRLSLTDVTPVQSEAPAYHYMIESRKKELSIEKRSTVYWYVPLRGQNIWKLENFDDRRKLWLLLSCWQKLQGLCQLKPLSLSLFLVIIFSQKIFSTAFQNYSVVC